MLNERIETLQRVVWEATVLLPEQASATSSLPAVEKNAGSVGLRLARYCTLEELVGLVFGAMTVLYIVASLISLS